MVAVSENEQKQLKDVEKKRTSAELDKQRRQLNGVFAVNKPVGLSSYDVVDRLKHLLFGMTPRGAKKARGKFHSKNNYKIGHGGTLDPLASGVLVIGVNKGTKSLNDYLHGEKIYIGEGLLGSMTDTYDSEGHLEMTAPYAHVTRDAIERVLDQFRGTIQQIPPKYSALKVNGRPMYDYARKGEEIPRELVAREVTIYSLELEEFTTDHQYKQPKSKPKPEQTLESSASDNNATTADMNEALMIAADADADVATNTSDGDGNASSIAENQVPPAIFRIRVSCSGGTYIRSLIYDIGQALGSTAHMVSLTRVQQGCFKLGQNVNEVESCNLDSVAESIEASQQQLLIKNDKPSS
ncbi:pseudouridine synthase [Syncephalis plumigaleata]|nr:pseudouridine synthase [Syncephalis plumigaleata]